jgi:hypothetical protein
MVNDVGRRLAFRPKPCLLRCNRLSAMQPSDQLPSDQLAPHARLRHVLGGFQRLSRHGTAGTPTMAA